MDYAQDSSRSQQDFLIASFHFYILFSLFQIVFPCIYTYTLHQCYALKFIFRIRLQVCRFVPPERGDILLSREGFRNQIHVWLKFFWLENFHCGISKRNAKHGLFHATPDKFLHIRCFVLHSIKLDVCVYVKIQNFVIQHSYNHFSGSRLENLFQYFKFYL